MRTVLKTLAVIFAGWLVLLLLVFIAGLIFREDVEDQTVLKITVAEAIPESPSSDLSSLLEEEAAIPLTALVRSIRRAATDERIVGLVLEVKRPRIGLAQLAEIESAMTVFRGSGKWNAAFLEADGNLAPEDGAYALAACTDSIVLTPPGGITLGGLRAEVPFLRGMLDKLNVRADVEKREAYKSAADMFTETDISPANRQALSELLGDLGGSLAAHIAARRNVAPEKVREWIAAGPQSADEAKSAGLVDELGYWDTLLDRARAKAERDEPFLEVAKYHALSAAQEPGPTFALIVGEGEISSGESSGGPRGGMGSDTITEAFRKARGDEVKAVLFRVDSPGGSYVASDAIRREVQITREAGIPVVAWMGNLAASGGYLVSCDADRIVAAPGTITGSIGVFTVHFATRELFKKWLGVTFGVVDTNPEGEMYTGLDPLPAEGKRELDAIADRVYAELIAKVAVGRKKKPEEIEPHAKGRVWSGRMALERGLVDEVGTLEVALARLTELAGLPADTEVKLLLYPEPKGTLQAVLELLGTSARGIHVASALAKTLVGDGLVRLPLGIAPEL